MSKSSKRVILFSLLEFPSLKIDNSVKDKRLLSRGQQGYMRSGRIEKEKYRRRETNSLRKSKSFANSLFSQRMQEPRDKVWTTLMLMAHTLIKASRARTITHQGFILNHLIIHP